MPELPYFDLLIDERQSDSQIAQLWKHQVHWGFWERPKAAAGTRADYYAAMARMNSVVLAAGKVASGQRLLDVGCGFGGTIQQIAAECSAMHLTGLNIDQRQLAVAKTQTTAVNGNHINWVAADACQLPFEDSSFDRVLSVECIFHFSSRERFLAEAARVLKPGGYLALSDFTPTIALFGRNPLWTAIRPQIEKSYGTLARVPLRSYAAMGKRAGLHLEANRNIRRNTLPTYPFLIKFIREQGSAEAAKTLLVGTRWMKWMANIGVMQYRVYTFGKPA